MYMSQCSYTGDFCLCIATQGLSVTLEYSYIAVLSTTVHVQSHV